MTINPFCGVTPSNSIMRIPGSEVSTLSANDGPGTAVVAGAVYSGQAASEPGSRTCRGSTPSSAAPSRSRAMGRRCGKGEGYSDLEFAILRELGHPPVPVATTVHDLQVVDSCPATPPISRSV
jgi:hypothetical protein